MKRAAIIFISLMLLLCMTACGNGPGQDDSNGSNTESDATEAETGYGNIGDDRTTINNVLVVYFSATGTTKQIAGYAADILNADLYEIVPEDPYTDEDLDYYRGGRADTEQNDPAARPSISGGVENMGRNDTVILDYPIWHGQAPRIVSTFLESYDFDGETLVPFFTSHSSGLGSSAANLYELTTGSNWLDGERFSFEFSKEEV